MESASLRLYVLKYSTSRPYFRVWLGANNTEQNHINKKIGCDYFLFSINEIDASVNVNEKITEVKIKNLKLYNVKLHDLKKFVPE